ncbi:unnamed protein product [Ranitomeya imitator]|uniref:Uncharacterized protein n=1 Tax=Ranitomeya imitator TaxID=111125 RepID=A0ABN9L9Z1_9NEOB|nr:unnamed protein product [Ranitomeya imitator]
MEDQTPPTSPDGSIKDSTPERFQIPYSDDWSGDDDDVPQEDGDDVPQEDDDDVPQEDGDDVPQEDDDDVPQEDDEDDVPQEDDDDVRQEDDDDVPQENDDDVPQEDDDNVRQEDDDDVPQEDDDDVPQEDKDYDDDNHIPHNDHDVQHDDDDQILQDNVIDDDLVIVKVEEIEGDEEYIRTEGHPTEDYSTTDISQASGVPAITNSSSAILSPSTANLSVSLNFLLYLQISLNSSPLKYAFMASHTGSRLFGSKLDQIIKDATGGTSPLSPRLILVALLLDGSFGLFGLFHRLTAPTSFSQQHQSPQARQEKKAVPFRPTPSWRPRYSPGRSSRPGLEDPPQHDSDKTPTHLPGWVAVFSFFQGRLHLRSRGCMGQGSCILGIQDRVRFHDPGIVSSNPDLPEIPL